ncbi:MAG TPA: LysR family transcriptional regulator [Pelotomaculum sp.]|nr:LysR family transcriptional regulator [Pelotomaculum sp.]
MRLEQLYHLVEAYKAKSITVAAERSFISQSALSLSISKLEKELGVTLLKRTNKGVYPTPTGKYVINNIIKIIDIVDEIEAYAKSNSSTLSGNVIISATQVVIIPLLFDVFEYFKNNYPNVNFSLKEVSNDLEVLNSILCGTADFGILVITDNVFKKSVNCETLFTDQLVMYTHKDSPFVKKKSIALSEIPYDKVAYLTDSSEIVESMIISSLGSIDKLGNDNLRKMVYQGKAIGFLPKLATLYDYYVISGEIVPIPINDSRMAISYGLVYSKQHTISKVEQKFIALLKDSYKRLSIVLTETKKELTSQELVDSIVVIA